MPLPPPCPPCRPQPFSVAVFRGGAPRIARARAPKPRISRLAQKNAMRTTPSFFRGRNDARGRSKKRKRDMVHVQSCENKHSWKAHWASSVRAPPRLRPQSQPQSAPPRPSRREEPSRRRRSNQPPTTQPPKAAATPCLPARPPTRRLGGCCAPREISRDWQARGAQGGIGGGGGEGARHARHLHLHLAPGPRPARAPRALFLIFFSPERPRGRGGALGERAGGQIAFGRARAGGGAAVARVVVARAHAWRRARWVGGEGCGVRAAWGGGGREL